MKRLNFTVEFEPAEMKLIDGKVFDNQYEEFSKLGELDENLADGISQIDRIADGKYDWWQSPLDIQRTDVETLDGAIGQNRYWVGVWDSRNGYTPDKILRSQSRSDYAEKTMDRALTWLVSGNGVNSVLDEKGTKTVYKPYSNLESGKYVRAVSGGSYIRTN